MRESLTLEQYQAELLALAPPASGSEPVALTDAPGRVLAAPVRSAVGIPGFDNSAMDGYAVRLADVAAVPVRLRVVGDVPAGSAADPWAAPGECVRIMTGAPLPSFADTVIPVEHTEPDGDWATVTSAPTRCGAHVRRTGDDIEPGTELAGSGAEVTPSLLGALAGAGVVSVQVRPRPAVAVCATGDELVTDGSPLRRGQVYESNSRALAAALARHGAIPVRADPVRDDPVALAGWLDAISPRADLVVLTGGASVGAYDVVRDVLTEAGGSFRHVRIQPGKPQGWAVWKGVPVISLPGNPVSAQLSYELFVRPLLDRMLGRTERPWFTAVAGAAWTSPAGRRQIVPARLTTATDGRLTAEPAHPRGSASHVVTSLARADGYVMVDAEATTVGVGDLVRARWL